MKLSDLVSEDHLVNIGNPFRSIAFKELANAQRGLPELAMLDVQRANVGGVLSYVVEHVGDLTHRMAQYPDRSTYYCGYELVKPKVERSYDILTSPYGFVKEHEGNIKSNAEFRNISIEEFRERLDRALERYAAEHSKLKVWNEAQWRAREAAVCLGHQKWFQASTHLYKLSEHLNDPEDWEQFAGAFDPSFNQK